MSGPDTNWKPRRMLQRASNLLTSSGIPLVALEDIFTESTSESNSGSSSLSRHSLGTSIKRKLQGAKDSTMPLVRSISLRSPSKSGSPHRQTRRQTRSFSTDNSTPRPHLVHMNSPESINVTPNAPKAQPISQSTQLSQSRFIPRRLTMADVAVPQLLQQGVPMTKVSATRQKTFVFRLDPDQGQICWESKKLKISAPHAITIFIVLDAEQ
jgi:phosphatidylinositol phospholipase C, delta